MDREDSRLTLQGLAQRLDALERENERMYSKNADLRHKVATLEGSAKSLCGNRYLEEDELGASELDEHRPRGSRGGGPRVHRPRDSV